MPRPRNEGRVCDAVIRDLERRTNLTRTDLTRPEITKVGPPVDFEFTLGTIRYSLEHTELQSFPEQIGQAIDFSRMIEGPIQDLDGKLPTPGVYELVLPTDTKVPAKELQQVKKALADWILKCATEWRDAKPKKRDRHQAPSGDGDSVQAYPPGVPFQVHFARELHWAQSDEFDGELEISRFAPKNLPQDRSSSLTASLEKKLPKLFECRRRGGRAVLVLEESDFALSFFVTLTEALMSLSAGRHDMPDEIYLVSTYNFLEAWPVRLLFKDGDFRDLDSIRRDRLEVPKGELVDLTAAA